MTSQASFPSRILALAYRERRTRYAGGWLGPYWAQITPLVWIAFLVVLFQVLDRTPPIHTHAAIFVATGVLPYLLFRQTITTMARSIIANRHLRNIAPIRHDDILLGAGLVEAINMAMSACAIFGVLVFLGLAPSPADPFSVLVGFSLLFALSWSVGRLIAIIGLISDSWARAFPILLRPFFWISGIFYTATELPKGVQDVLFFNPLFHVIEIIRSGYFASYTSPLGNATYTLICTVALFILSSLIETPITRLGIERHRL